MATSSGAGASEVIKLLTIGDSGVGKSSLLLRWTNAETSKIKSSVATIGIDFKFKDVIIDGQRVKIQVVSLQSPFSLLRVWGPKAYLTARGG